MAWSRSTTTCIIPLFLLGTFASLLASVTADDNILKSSCDDDVGKSAKLKQNIQNFAECVKSVQESRPHPFKPMNCQQMDSLTKCINEYLESVKECYEDEVDLWNQTVHAIQSVRKQFCEESNNLINELYREDAWNCFNNSEVQDCGFSLTTLLLNPPEKKYDVLLLSAPLECSKVTKVNDCVLEKLRNRTICASSEVANTTSQINDVIANTTGCETQKDGASDFLVSSTVIWILAISVTGLVTLTPS